VADDSIFLNIFFLNIKVGGFFFFFLFVEPRERISNPSIPGFNLSTRCRPWPGCSKFVRKTAGPAQWAACCLDRQVGGGTGNLQAAKVRQCCQIAHPAALIGTLRETSRNPERAEMILFIKTMRKLSAVYQHQNPRPSVDGQFPN